MIDSGHHAAIDNYRLTGHVGGTGGQKQDELSIFIGFPLPPQGNFINHVKFGFFEPAHPV